MAKNSNRNKFGEKLRLDRISAGLSIGELSSKVKVSKGYISRIECGKDTPTSMMIEKLARAIGSDPEPLHVLAGSLPEDVKQILYDNPIASHACLRESFTTYRTQNAKQQENTDLLSNKTHRDDFTPKEIKKLYQIIHTDCFKWLPEQPENSIHAIVTDPPYGLKEYTQKEKEKLRNGNGGVWRIPPSYDGCQRSPLPRFTVLSEEEKIALKEFFKKWASLVFRILVPGGHVFIATNPLVSHLVYLPMIEAGFEKRGEIIRLVQTLRGGDRPKNAHKEFSEVTVMPRSCWEPWGLFRKPCEGRVQDNLKKWKTGGMRRLSEESPFCDVIKSAPTRSIERDIAPHPSLKPQAFMRQIVRASLPLGEGIVLDPFMGGGATISAACAVGYKSIGIESDDEFFRIALEAIPSLTRFVSDNGDISKAQKMVSQGILFE